MTFEEAIIKSDELQINAMRGDDAGSHAGFLMAMADALEKGSLPTDLIVRVLRKRAKPFLSCQVNSIDNPI